MRANLDTVEDHRMEHLITTNMVKKENQLRIANSNAISLHHVLLMNTPFQSRCASSGLAKSLHLEMKPSKQTISAI